MPAEPILKGEEVLKLIPQRPPVVMVDALYSVTVDSAETGLDIDPSCIFCRNGKLSEPGIVEHAAQSAAVFADYDSYVKGIPPRLGFIAELKHLQIALLPDAGKSLRTSLSLLGTAMGMSLMKVEVRCGDDVVAEGQMKIFIKE